MFGLNDPVPEIKRLGYTSREAEFLSLVAEVSGFFLARQYASFLDRKPGALIQQLLNKGEDRGHIEALDYGQRRFVYHLSSRTLYRLVQDEDSPARHVTGHDQIRAKLMALDYALEHIQESFLALPAEKREYFQKACGLALSVLPTSALPHTDSNDENGNRYFGDRWPIYAPSNGLGGPRSLRFIYFDPGLGTIQPFVRHLESYRPLLEELAEFQMVYVAYSDRHFEEAADNFNRIIAKKQATSTLVPRGVDHLMQFLEIKRMWDSNDSRLTGKHIHLLKQGEAIYRQPEHDQLASIWARNREKFRQELARLGGIKMTSGRLSFELSRGKYPVFLPPALRKSRKQSMESRIGRFSKSNSI